MNYHQFYDGIKNEFVSNLASLSFKEKVVFGIHCLRRNEGNYYHFSARENFGDPYFLSQIRKNVTEVLINSLSISSIELLLSKMEANGVVPDSEDYEDASIAIDACSIAYDLLKFCLSKDDKRLIQLTLTSIEVVEKWIYENFGYIEDDDPEFDTKLKSYKLMKNELDSHFNILALLNNENGVEILIKEMENNSISNLGFKMR